MSKPLIQIKNGNIMDVKIKDEKLSDGCETCDYGATYYAAIEIYFIQYGASHTIIKEVGAEGDYYKHISFVQLVNFFGRRDLQDMTLEQVAAELKKEFF